jgi:glycerol-3-phosphate acyltransferase PlsY
MIYLLPPLAYLLGSVSAAVVVSRIMGLQDPREVGSKNPGATNVLRYGGKLAAVLTLVGDILKGVLAVVVARLLTEDPLVLAGTALGAFLGHLFPLFFGFKGGKGVATAAGVWFALNVWVGLLMVGTWLLAALVTRYSSLSALIAAGLAPLYVAWLMPPPAYVVAMFMMSALLFYRHAGNIRRLLAGQEKRIGK